MFRSLVLLPLLAGCPVPETRDCDAMAVASVTLTVVAEDGSAVPDATVTFAVDGGEPAPCDSFDGTWTCGWEASGDLTIRVEAEGYEAWEQTVAIERGECHVESQAVTATLTPESVDCTEEERPSVLATVVGSSGEALEDVHVTWSNPDTDGLPRDCDAYTEGVWACGWEVAGAIRVDATAAGHESGSAEVTVGEDECHVITEEVEIALEWLPD